MPFSPMHTQCLCASASRTDGEEEGRRVLAPVEEGALLGGHPRRVSRLQLLAGVEPAEVRRAVAQKRRQRHRLEAARPLELLGKLGAPRLRRSEGKVGAAADGLDGDDGAGVVEEQEAAIGGEAEVGRRGELEEGEARVPPCGLSAASCGKKSACMSITTSASSGPSGASAAGDGPPARPSHSLKRSESRSSMCQLNG